jgi:hypothetical protein
VVGVTVGGCEEVEVAVAAGVGVREAVGVATVVLVGVGLGPAVAVVVGVLVGPLEVSITNCGAFAPSRLEKLMLVVLKENC